MMFCSSSVRLCRTLTLILPGTTNLRHGTRARISEESSLPPETSGRGIPWIGADSGGTEELGHFLETFDSLLLNALQLGDHGSPCGRIERFTMTLNCSFNILCKIGVYGGG